MTDAQAEPNEQADALHEPITVRTHWRVDRFEGDVTPEQVERGDKLIESVEVDGNILVTAGITLLLNLLIGAGGAAFTNAVAQLGVGDNTTAAAIGQTDLVAATNKLRRGMDATYPQVATNVVTFRSTFATGDANYAWEEFGAFNAAAAGTMLNRRVQTMGTKSSAATWVLTMTLTLT